MSPHTQTETRPEPKAHEALTDPESWVDRYGDYLYRYALVRVHNPKAAEDLVQETFLAALNAMKDFSGRSSEKTWLIGILKHKIVDYFRKSSREYAVEDPEAAGDPAEDSFDRKGEWKVKPSEWTTDPSLALEQQEFMDVLQECLSALPGRLGHAFVLREMEDMTSDEICKVLDITPTNLWVVLHRARLRLKSCLEANWLAKNREE
ncbi:MAG: sigma-70 family RNA polymerase sigma factor [Kiritimatiellae bacterium]|nr:sigma-70 family RNA polymerase sigma factor [Kiritimatiellia bacterium]